MTFYAPMVAADFARDDGVDLGQLEACAWRAMMPGRLAQSDGLAGAACWGC